LKTLLIVCRIAWSLGACDEICTDLYIPVLIFFLVLSGGLKPLISTPKELAKELSFTVDPLIAGGAFGSAII
jgi:hypothetical protein